MKNRLRRRMFVDSKVQGTLILRATMYWFYCLLSVTLLTACWTMLTETRPLSSLQLVQQVWMRCGPALVASVLLLPMVLFDFIRWSNRFAGPILRLRRGMKQLANGEDPSPIKFRDGDFWYDFAEDFNRVAGRIQNSESALPQAAQAECCQNEDWREPALH